MAGDTTDPETEKKMGLLRAFFDSVRSRFEPIDMSYVTLSVEPSPEILLEQWLADADTLAPKLDTAKPGTQQHKTAAAIAPVARGLLALYRAAWQGINMRVGQSPDANLPVFSDRAVVLLWPDTLPTELPFPEDFRPGGRLQLDGILIAADPQSGNAQLMLLLPYAGQATPATGFSAVAFRSSGTTGVHLCSQGLPNRRNLMYSQLGLRNPDQVWDGPQAALYGSIRATYGADDAGLIIDFVAGLGSQLEQIAAALQQPQED